MQRTNRYYCECDPTVNTKYFCTFNDVDANLTRGGGGVMQKGPMSYNCVSFNKVDCSKEWDDRCEFLSKDTRPKTSSACSLWNYSNGAFSQGDDLVVEAARTKFCKISGGVEKTFDVLDFTDCTLQNTDMMAANSFDCNIEDPTSLDDDMLFNKMISRGLGNDIVLNMYKNAINSGKNVSGTLLEKRVKEISRNYNFATAFPSQTGSVNTVYGRFF